jgi:hypothetical protein
MRNSLHIQLDRLASDRWARRGVRILVRSVWLGLSLCCVGLGASLFLGIVLPWQWLAALALGCVAGGAVLILRPRMPAGEVARRLDRRFRLDEQIATALELSADPIGVEAYLLDESRRTVGQIRRTVGGRQGFPWAEAALILALLVILGGLVVMMGIGVPGPLAAPDLLPPLARPQDPAAQFPDEPFNAPGGEQPGPGPVDSAGQNPGAGDPAAMRALADALRDQSVTRQAAEALDQGDLAGAAASLRALADQAGQVSQQARNELASALRRAASQAQASSPQLADQLRSSADGLQSGNDSKAAQALEDLAGAVEDMGAGQANQPGAGQQPGNAQAPGQGQSQEAGQGQGGGAGNSSLPGQQREQPSDRLGVDGVPLELEAKGDGTIPTQGQANDSAGGTGNGGDFSQGGASPSTDPVQAADDPLRIPADLRDVVQDYFSP